LLWTYGAHNATAANAFTSLDASSGALVWDHTNGGFNSFSGIWGHFMPGASPLALQIGETLELHFDVTFSGGAFATSNAAFRWGLFDSNNSRVTTDFAGTNATGLSSGATFGAWRGYIAQTGVNTIDVVGNTLLARERTGGGSALFDSAQYADITGSGVNEPIFAAGVSYPGALSLTRTASGMNVRASINGVSTNLALDGTPVLEFDTVSFFTVDAATQNITLDNVVVQIVPEPSSAFLLGAAALSFTARRRRRLAL
jgi:hypothetical protein